ncbi:hypothetical protein [Oceanivirga miroungae]|uniref:Uncharacterized protein n=1 Tax=Oceanivirga miroungae TaxID=1130046 RepID=A0A6I8M6X0_9FUSO|nr:hypothetical protein [Oceanivirga miroungae]VWL85145.1 hypothetical protein OMES3154_00429 [Oceanivirga miroungae]
MSIKYTYNYDNLDYYLLENLHDINKYPLFNAKIRKILDNNIEVLEYILNAIRIKKENNKLIEKINKSFLDIDIITYEFNEYVYMVFNLKESKKALFKKNNLGVLVIDDKLNEEILELDQILQCALSIDLVLELMEENEDMNKYKDLVEKEVREEHLDKFFFFDNFVYKIFMKGFINTLISNKVFDNDRFIKVLGEINE